MSDFSFDGFSKKANIVVTIEASQGMGKTHMSCTFPGVRLADTEFRAEMVMEKFKNPNFKGIGDFDTIRQMVMYCLQNSSNPGTIVIDSGSDLQKLAENEFLLEAKKDKVYPLMLWGKVYEKMDNMIKVVREYGWNLVFTLRLKPEYDKEGNKTGELIAEGYKRFPYFSDVIIRLQKGIEYEGRILFPNITVGKVIDNKWHPKGDTKPYLIDLSYDGIFKELKPKWDGNIETIVKEVETKYKVKAEEE